MGFWLFFETHSEGDNVIDMGGMKNKIYVLFCVKLMITYVKNWL